MSGGLHRFRSRLFFKQAIASVLIAFAIGSVLAALQIYNDMLAEQQRVEAYGAYRLGPALDSLTLAAFRLDERVASDVAKGLIVDEAVTRVLVRDDFGDVLAEVSKEPAHTAVLVFGSLFGREPLVTVRPLVMEDESLTVGEVELAVDPLVASRDFSYRTLNTVSNGVIKSLLLSLALMFYFYRTGTKRINELNRKYRSAFNHKPSSTECDEIDELLQSLEAWAGEKVEFASRLDRLAKRVQLATSVADIGIWEMDIEADALRWDDTMHEIFGTSQTHFRGVFDDWRARVHPEDLLASEAKFFAAVESGNIFDDQFRIITPDGAEKHVEAKAQVVILKDGSKRAVGVNFDITDRVRREAELISAREAADRATARMRYDAMHDTLTDLHNRRALDVRMRELEAAFTRDEEVAFLQIDLDRFKSINDAFGHGVGDYVLKETSRALAALEAEGAFIARIGGDEFSVVLTGGDVRTRAIEAAHAIISQCAQPIEYENLLLHSGASVGIAIGGAVQLSQLHENADIALYVAKRSRGDGYKIFDSEMRQEAERHKSIADGLRMALSHNQLIVHFQPKLHARTRDLAGLEALVRWKHPELGMVPPSEFLCVAEEIGIGNEIDRRVLRLALDAARRLCALNLDIPQIAVNVSLQRLKDSQLLDHLDSLGDFPCQLVFEVLETVDLGQVHNELSWVLEGLRERGVKIEIDDFGTGHASITSLLTVQPDGLKLDRSLVAGVKGMKLPSEDMLRALIDIGRASDITITAEGVETEHQAQLLERLGCDVLQGFLFAKPMPEDELVVWLHTRTEPASHVSIV